MATATQNDESDLLILSDEPTILNENKVLEDNLDENNWELITFDDMDNESNQESDISFDLGDTEESPKKDEEVLDESNQESDISFDLWWAEEIEQSENTILDNSKDEISKEEETISDNNFNIKSDDTNSIQNDELSSMVTNENIWHVFNLKEATESFITQLEARKKQIFNDISDDEKIITIKESKIKDLRWEINDYRKLIKELNDESDEINNKINLVSWNNIANNIKKTTSTRVHNAKRKKAA